MLRLPFCSRDPKCSGVYLYCLELVYGFVFFVQAPNVYVLANVHSSFFVASLPNMKALSVCRQLQRNITNLVSMKLLAFQQKSREKKRVVS